MRQTSSEQFHGQYDAKPHLRLLAEARNEMGELNGERTTGTSHIVTKKRALSYRFFSHFHPYVTELIERLVEDSVKGLEAQDTRDPQTPPLLYETIFSTQGRYQPSALVDKDYYPVKDLDFSPGGAYSVYNWELFFHVPLTVAIGLSRNGRYEESQRWFHYIFDPTDDSDGPTPERFWKVRPFQQTEVKQIEEILVNLSTGQDKALREATIRSIEAIKDAPFRPHVVARYRQSAYMFKTVMSYLDNLIAWGDSLFREDSREAINEATQVYVLAANILGSRPQMVPEKGSVRPQTYADLRADLDEFSNALREIEADVPFDLTPPPVPASNGNKQTSLRNFGTALYFCVPRNDKLLGYWDTVADRLYKIRNSLNIKGIFRQLPLFAPPIDPALLAKAAAAGLDVDAIVAGANQPLPLVRFQPLLQKASELSQEVKALGGELLSAIEKEDNEALALLRAKHERSALEIGETVRYQQLQEAIKAREGLVKTLASAAQRFVYYERLLGGQGPEPATDLDDVDRGALEKMKFKVDEPEVATREIEVDIVSGGPAAVADRKISSHELEELEKLGGAQTAQDVAATIDTIAAIIHLIPMFAVRATPIGIGGGLEIGGENIAALLSTIANVSRAVGARQSFEASQTAKIGSYARREQDWAYQSNLAAAEINQIYKQLRAAQIRESIAEREWKNHQAAIDNAKEIEHFLTDERDGKRTNKDFYGWMKREARALHTQCFQLAFDTAKKAERALQHELGDPEARFINYGYTAGKEGLQAGEKLHLDIKRMELAYNDLNQREYELTKNVSLMQVDPLALMQLRATGSCTVELPEELFDMDGPGHYFRRIKSVAVSVPCVTGPYTSVNCTLSLLRSSIRKKPTLDEDGSYARDGSEDPRFSDHFGSLESIVTSAGQGDSGMFETNLHDERYLPFEGSGAISQWRLQLPANESHDVRQFDYDTIADVVLHVRYTAREGGDLLKNGALGNLETAITEARANGSVRLLSARHEFAGAWAKFKNAPAATAKKWPQLTLELKPEHYPFWSLGRLKRIESVTAFARAGGKVDLQNKADPTLDTTKRDKLEAKLGDLYWGRLTEISNPSPTGSFDLFLKDQSIEDLWIALAWAGEKS